MVGCTGSGKTVTIRLLMQSVLPKIVSDGNERALVYDAKGDMLPLLHGMGLQCEVITLNPVDARGYAWDIAADVADLNAVKTVAEILVPEENETQKFFPRAARRILEGVLRVLVRQAPGRWTLCDVLLILNDRNLLKKVLESTRATRVLVDKYWEPLATFQNVLSTLDSLVSRYETVAAAWSRAAEAGRKVSLQDWAKSSMVLVLGNDERIRPALDPMNRAIFERVVQLLIGGEELVAQGGARTWVFLDEAAKAGKLPGLDNLLLKGRSKGVCAVLGFQDIAAMREEYGQNAADALLGQCVNKAFLRLNSDATAEWASKQFGDYLAVESLTSHSTSTSYGSGSSTSQDSTTISEQRTKREAVMPAEFFGLDVPSQEGGVDGYYLTACIGAYHLRYKFAPFLKRRLEIPDRLERAAEDQELEGTLGAEELTRLGLSGALKEEQAAKRAEQAQERETSARATPFVA